MQIRNYSQRSIETYIHMLRSLEEYHNRCVDESTIDQVKDFLQYCIEKKQVSVSYINQIISAVKILRTIKSLAAATAITSAAAEHMLFCQA
jgi:hypothetical protein